MIAEQKRQVDYALTLLREVLSMLEHRACNQGGNTTISLATAGQLQEAVARIRSVLRAEKLI